MRKLGHSCIDFSEVISVSLKPSVDVSGQWTAFHSHSETQVPPILRAACLQFPESSLLEESTGGEGPKVLHIPYPCSFRQNLVEWPISLKEILGNVSSLCLGGRGNCFLELLACLPYSHNLSSSFWGSQ